MSSVEEELLYQVLEAITNRIEDISRTVAVILDQLATHSHGYVHPPVYGS